MNRTRIIIADDHTLFADGLEQIVQSLDTFDVIGKVTDGKMLMQKLNTDVPDMILMDVNMPFLNGMEAAQKILSRFPKMKIIFISMYNNAQLTEQAKKMGAAGFIMKDVTAPVLKEAILNVNKGLTAFPVATAQVIVPGFPEEEDPFLLRYKLSPRELDILQLIKEGKASKQIAGILDLSVYTVETHRKNIHRKLHVQSTAELIALAHKMK
ncbi:response regulator [Niabella drilacis]|uniref:DNA-binding response regulator, NarL/FixJ family, contains REC and HTH domains n=1 Tax=Niabella drilacis (strain DSM 25811 / CCM 8410 / CCUG 62505 / LMG 26954 / E90) TaxID=1285928 RepID=A0A1G6SX08_NIADE|nr:response regulator transcription factor [Niabella drilacis]SDD21358.1 DNA-binding response regulator, NarL/FixJ family, contains REC and HTH domains [Niabella drilacis]